MYSFQCLPRTHTHTHIYIYHKVSKYASFFLQIVFTSNLFFKLSCALRKTLDVTQDLLLYLVLAVKKPFLSDFHKRSSFPSQLIRWVPFMFHVRKMQLFLWAICDNDTHTRLFEFDSKEDFSHNDQDDILPSSKPTASIWLSGFHATHAAFVPFVTLEMISMPVALKRNIFPSDIVAAKVSF